MGEVTEMMQRHAGQLARLAALAESAARIAHERLLAAQTPAETAQLIQALHRSARAVRQCIYLEVKIANDREKWSQAVEAEERRREGLAVRRRRERVQLAVTRAINTDASVEDAESLVEDLDDRLEEVELADGFAVGSIDTYIARVCRDLGVTPPADVVVEAEEGGRDLPRTRPPPQPEGLGREGQTWRTPPDWSSA